jgi:methionyl-tRNA formyltransferase
MTNRSHIENDRPLKLLFVTEDDPLYVVEFFAVFFAEYPRADFEIVAVTVDRAFHEPLWKTVKRMWRFYGAVGFIRQGLRFVGRKLRGRSIERLAKANGITLLPTDSVNTEAYAKSVEQLKPDLVISVAAPQIFKERLLRSATWGCINIHAGQLPTYRGMMPNFWQMRYGEPHATVTVHEMAAELDAGRVLGTRTVPIQSQDSLGRLMRETKREGARLMIEVLKDIKAGTIEPEPVDMGSPGYFSFPKPDDVAAFHAQGHRLL